MEAIFLKVDEKGFFVAVDFLRRTQLVAFPTETVYGLGADATSVEATRRLYAAKGRPSSNPLIAHVDGLEMAEKEAVFNEDAFRLAQSFWPGPLTIVAPAASTGRVCLEARAGAETVALRAPDHAVALRLIQSFGKPIVAPSANVSGYISPTTAQHVFNDLKHEVAGIFNSPPTLLGVESTIVACLEETIQLRSGAILPEALEAVLGKKVVRMNSALAPASPGQASSHYAPHAFLRLNAKNLSSGETFLTFGEFYPDGFSDKTHFLDLSPSGSLVEAAAKLYDYLRRLDSAGGSIAVAPIPLEGLGVTIMDRLKRAAAPR